jgi:VWFA-related protein
MRQRFKSSILPTAVLATLLLPLPALAQDSAATFDEAIDVRVVNVEAVVTDRGGARVFGLTPDDFQLLVDGEEVPIDFFTEFRGGEALRDVGASPWDLAPISDVQAEGTSYLVFVDDFFSVPVDRNRVLRALEDELAFLGPEDRMAIVAWDGVRTEMLSTWSSDEREIRWALQTATARPAEGLYRIAERRSILSGTYIPIPARSLGRRRLAITERVYSKILIDQVESAVSAASATLRGFAAPPGRKVMLLASGGWPFRPSEFVTGDPIAAAFDQRFEQGEEIYGPLVDYTLYPIDAPGLEGDSRVSAANDAAVLRTAGVGSLDFYRETELHDSLRFLARETGGRALINGQRMEPLSRVADDTRSFYWLGFNPDRTGDSEIRSIELKLKQKGLEARTRSGYRDLSIEEEITMQVASALLFGFPAHSQELAVEFGSSQREKRKTMIVPVTVRLPASAIALLPAGDEFAANLEVRVAAIDGRGDRSGVTTLPWRVIREELPEGNEDLEFEISLRLRRAAQDLVVAVYDTNSGELFSASSSIVPAS